MNILQVTPAFYPSMFYGGGPTVAYEISKKLVNFGHNVVVYTTNAFDKTMKIKDDYIKLNDIDVYYFKNISNYKKLFYIILNSNFNNSQKKIYNKNKKYI